MRSTFFPPISGSLFFVFCIVSLVLPFASANLVAKFALMDCAAFSLLYPGIVFLRGTAEYSKSANNYFAAFENEVDPMCVVQPRSSEELAKIIKHLSTISPLPRVAIKGGGHTAWAGAANIQDGVLIDMIKFDNISINQNTKTVSIGAGQRWANVYERLVPLGLGVHGGRVSKVGVSGLILGGGLSPYLETGGFVCDQVTNFEVVLASGQIVQANKQSNTDLFKALKGGNNNFGIVTKIGLPVFPQGKMWGGLVFYTADAWPSVADKYLEFSEAPDKHGSLTFARIYSPLMEGVSVNAYSTSTTEVAPALREITTVQPSNLSTIREDSPLGFADEQSSFSTDGARQLFFTTSFRNSKQVILKAEKLHQEAVSELKSVPGFVLALTMQPLTKQALQESENQGENSLGLSPADGPLVIVLLNSVHQNKPDDAKVISRVQKLLTDIEELSKAEGVAAKFRFMNYAYKGTPVFQGYGAESIAALKAASKKYDPTQFFQKAVPGAFKISEVR